MIVRFRCGCVDRNNATGIERRDEVAGPSACVYARVSFVTMMDGDRLGVVGDDVVAKSVMANEGAPGERSSFTLDMRLVRRGSFAFDDVLLRGANSMSEVDRRSKQCAQVADRVLRQA
jgi:hypothetical protein